MISDRKLDHNMTNGMCQRVLKNGNSKNIICHNGRVNKATDHGRN